MSKIVAGLSAVAGVLSKVIGVATLVETAFPRLGSKTLMKLSQRLRVQSSRHGLEASAKGFHCVKPQMDLRFCQLVHDIG